MSAEPASCLGSTLPEAAARPWEIVGGFVTGDGAGGCCRPTPPWWPLASYYPTIPLSLRRRVSRGAGQLCPDGSPAQSPRAPRCQHGCAETCPLPLDLFTPPIHPLTAAGGVRAVVAAVGRGREGRRNRWVNPLPPPPNEHNATNFFSVWLQLPLAKVLVHVATSSAYRLRFCGCWPASHPQQPAGGRATPIIPSRACSLPSQPLTSISLSRRSSSSLTLAAHQGGPSLHLWAPILPSILLGYGTNTVSSPLRSLVVCPGTPAPPLCRAQTLSKLFTFPSLFRLQRAGLPPAGPAPVACGWPVV